MIKKILAWFGFKKKAQPAEECPMNQMYLDPFAGIAMVQPVKEEKKMPAIDLPPVPKPPRKRKPRKPKQPVVVVQPTPPVAPAPKKKRAPRKKKPSVQ